MINAPYDKEFVFHDGRRAKNILELAYIMQRFDPSEFSGFVNDSKNDFANWAEYVLYDKTLAGRLRTTMMLENTKIILSQRISELQKEEEQLNKAEDKEASKELKKQAHETSVQDVVASKNTGFRESRNEVIHESRHESKNNETRETKHEEKHAKDGKKNDGSESTLWMIIYGVLIGLIVIIVMYKFIFS